MSDIPTRVPPDSPLAPPWYKLEDKDEANASSVGELTLVIWFGTQADEMFPNAWHSDVAAFSGDSVMNTRSKVHLSPTLWYLRVDIIEAQDLFFPSNRNRITEVYVKATLGNVKLRTKVSGLRQTSLNPRWKMAQSRKDGGYHVFDESVDCSSDYRATFKGLWPPAIGVLELGIVSASGSVPMKSRDGNETTDAYCVAKVGTDKNNS
ncbi:hypothetical protein V6N13_138244 [Hibiscus sabdariffa]